MTESPAAHADGSPVRAETIARFELDAFCETCAYNLRGQEVWKDERLGLLICRCPECGTHQPANQSLPSKRLWVKWFTPAVLIVWITIVFGMHAAAMGIIGATWGGATEVVYHAAQGFGGEDALLLLSLLGSANALIGFMLALFSAIAFGHWPTIGRIVLAVLWPCVPFGVYLFGWLYVKDEQMGMAAPQVLLLASIVVIAGIVGALIGRPVARLAVRVFLPRGMRQGMAFLWTCDGMKPPVVK